MLTDSEVKSRFRDALEAVTPPSPWLAGRIQEAVEARTQIGSRRRTPRALRVSLRLLAVAVLIVLVVVGVAAFLSARYSQPRAIPAGPSVSAVSPGWAYGPVAMVNASDGWEYGVPFRHTTDGGVSWTDVTPNGVGRSFDEYYLDATHAWVIDLSGAGPPLQFTTYLTADGARTWQRGSPTSISVGSGLVAGYDFRFVDPDHGWLLVSKRDAASAVYSDNLYKTSDGGLHWAIAAVHNAPLTWNPGKFYCYEWCGPMAFASATTGWLSTVSYSNPTKLTLLVTHNAGVTWRPQTLPITSPTVGCPCSPVSLTVFDEARVAFQIYSQASRRITLLETSDGGATWAPRALPRVADVRVGFYDSNHGWLLDQSGLGATSFTSPAVRLRLYRTDDGGVTWTSVQTNLELQSIDGQVVSLYFVDQKDGFAIRANATSAGCQPSGLGCTSAPVWSLLKTTDGGQTWSAVNPSV